MGHNSQQWAVLNTNASTFHIPAFVYPRPFSVRHSYNTYITLAGASYYEMYIVQDYSGTNLPDYSPLEYWRFMCSKNSMFFYPRNGDISNPDIDREGQEVCYVRVFSTCD